MKKLKSIETTVVVHGKWVAEDGEDYFCCNKCGCAIGREYVSWFNFCPNCGADMRKGENDGW